MPLVRLIAENVGPFERLDIDFSDGNGKPHRGPHILAGVNGSGKSTVLRAIAWALSFDGDGFPEGEWRHFLHGKPKVAIHVAPDNGAAFIMQVSTQWDEVWHEVERLAASLGLESPGVWAADAPFRWKRFGRPPTNLFPLCQICNNSKGHTNHTGSLLKPDDEDPEEFFWIGPEGDIEPRPGLPAERAARAAETIRLCDLNRGDLREARQEVGGRGSRVALKRSGGAMEKTVAPSARVQTCDTSHSDHKSLIRPRRARPHTIPNGLLLTTLHK